MTPTTECLELATRIAALIAAMPVAVAADTLNAVNTTINSAGPFAQEPIATVQWVPAKDVKDNGYSPTVIDSRKTALLKQSIQQDGMLAPLVTDKTAKGDVIVGGVVTADVIRGDKRLRERLHGYVPVVRIMSGADDRRRRAISHRLNNARGRAAVDKEAAVFAFVTGDGGWDPPTVAKEFGYETDYIIRLMQITGGDGVLDLYKGRDFGRAHRMVE